jgi:hypothetical protein
MRALAMLRAIDFTRRHEDGVPGRKAPCDFVAAENAADGQETGFAGRGTSSCLRVMPIPFFLTEGQEMDPRVRGDDEVGADAQPLRALAPLRELPTFFSASLSFLRVSA